MASNKESIISFIPGISLNDEEKHAFVQVIISPSMDTYYFKYSIDEFHSDENYFKIQIGNNIFSKDGIKIDLVNEKVSLSGNLDFKDIQSIERNVLRPNIMGPFGYLTFMQCNHGVISMKHKVTGSIKINDDTLFFNESSGYIEKDWGNSFPKDYIWLQCNNFPQKNVSFMFSLAKIPFMKFNFRGFLCNLRIEGKEYRFATYTGAKIKSLIFTKDTVEITAEDSKYNLYIFAESKNSGALLAPQNGKMKDTIKEGIEGEILLKLTDKKGKCLLNSKGQYGGIERVTEQT